MICVQERVVVSGVRIDLRVSAKHKKIDEQNISVRPVRTHHKNVIRQTFNRYGCLVPKRGGLGWGALGSSWLG